MQRAVSLLLIFAIILSCGCATTGSSTKKGAGTGAILGGIAGALRGLLTGGNVGDVVKQAAIGAAAGAAIGAAVGAVQDRRVAERNAAIEQYAYSNSQGHFIRVESMALSNPRPSRGESVTATIRYTAISPEARENLSVTGTPVLRVGDEQVVLDSFTSHVERGGGTMEVSFPINLGDTSPTGRYTLEMTLAVEGASARDHSQVEMYVS